MNVVYELLGVDNASAAIQKVEKSFNGLEKSWGKVLAVLGAGGTVGALTAMVKDSLASADAMAKMSQSTGVAVETLSGLKLAAQLAGVDMQLLAGSIGKMQKAMVEAQQGNQELRALFKALGVDVNGGTKEALYAIADAFQKMPDGAQKAAAAMQVFGKSGAALIPFLNQGAEGIRQMEEMAAKLGLTLTEETAKGAEQINDTLTILHMQSKGFANQLMQSLLPTLQGFAKILWDSAGQGGAAKIIIEGLTYAFKGLASVVLVAWAQLKNVGIAIGSVAAASAMVAQGNFRGALDTLAAGWDDIKINSAATQETLKQLWSDTLPKMDNATVKAAKELGNWAQAGKDADEALKRLQKDAQDFAAENIKLIESTQAYVQAQALEIAGGQKLTEAQKEMLKIGEFLRKNAQKLTEAELDYYRAELLRIEANREIIEASKARQKADEEIAKTTEDWTKSEIKSLQTIKDGNEALKAENDQIGLSKAQQAQYKIAIEETTLAKLRAKLETFELSDAERQLFEQQVKAQEERIRLMQEGAGKQAAVDEANAARQEWERVANQIEDALTQALVKGFGAGKSIVQSIGTYIVNFFKSTIARGIAQALLGAVATGLSGVANAAGASGLGSMLGSAVGAAGTGAGLLAPAGGILGMGNVGAGLWAGLSGVFGEAGLSGSLSAGWTALTAGNIGGGLGTLAGAAAPYLLAAYAAYRILSGAGTGRRRGPAYQSYGALTGAGDAFTPSYPTPNIGYGGAGGYNEQVGAILKTINATAGIFGGTTDQTLKYGLFTSTSPDGRGAQAVGNVWDATGKTLFDYNVNGANEDVMQRLASAMPGMILVGLQRSNLPARISEYFNSVTAQGITQEELDQMVATASAAHAMARAFQDLGGPFAQLSTLSVEARVALADLTGGMDAFMQKVSGYYQTYYSTEEQQAMTLVDVAKTLKGAGIDLTQLTDKSSYRSMVEGLDLTTETGQKQFAALMNSAAGFAYGADLLSALGLNLGEFTAGAPGMQEFSDAVTSAQEQTNQILTSINDSVKSVGEAIVEAIGSQAISVNFTSNVGGTVEVGQWGGTVGGGN